MTSTLFDTRGDATAPPAPGPAAAPHAGSLRPPTRLATGRAALGGLLVALAALGVFAAWSRAAAPPSTRYLVAADDLPAGSHLTVDDVAWVTVDLPDVVAGRVLDDPSAVADAVTLAPLSEGDLLTTTAVAPAADAPDAPREVALTLDRARAVGGDLAPGERVDVLATYGTGTDAWTEVLARHAAVVGVADAADGGLAATGQVVVTIGLSAPDDVIATINALDAGVVTLVRTTAAADGGAEPSQDIADEGAADTFRPSPPPDPATSTVGAGAG